LLSCLCGILFIGTILYLYIYYNMRRRLFLSIILNGILGIVFAGSEIFVIALGAVGYVRAGMEFHRVEALSVLFFIPLCPFFLNEILAVSDRVRSFNRLLTILGLVFSLIVIAVAYIQPDLFLGFNKYYGPNITPWNISRGVPGLLYNIRDMLVVFIALYTLASITADIFINRQYRYLGMILAGLVLAVVRVLQTWYTLPLNSLKAFSPGGSFPISVSGSRFSS